MRHSTHDGLSIPPSAFAIVSRLGVPALGRSNSPPFPLMPFCDEPYGVALGVGQFAWTFSGGVCRRACDGPAVFSASCVVGVGHARAAPRSVGFPRICVSLPLEPSAASGVGHIDACRTAVGRLGPPPLLTVSNPPGLSASCAGFARHLPEWPEMSGMPRKWRAGSLLILPPVEVSDACRVPCHGIFERALQLATSNHGYSAANAALKGTPSNPHGLPQSVEMLDPRYECLV